MQPLKSILAIARREVSAYFATPVGWVSLCAFLALTGFFFVVFINFYTLQSAETAFSPYGDGMDLNEQLVGPFYANMSILLLFICPALTMRLFAEDRKTRSLELLLTSPISTTEIVLGKFLGAMGFITVLMACTLHFPAMLYWLGEPDIGVLGSCYVAIFLLAGAFMAVGLLTSAFTENQVVALIVSFVMLLGLWVLGWAESAVSTPQLEQVLTHASMINRMEDLTRGLVHSRDLVYFTSFIGLVLFATHQRVEAYRWS